MGYEITLMLVTAVTLASLSHCLSLVLDATIFRP